MPLTSIGAESGKNSANPVYAYVGHSEPLKARCALGRGRSPDPSGVNGLTADSQEGR